MLPAILKYAKDADIPITALNCSPVYSEKKGRVTKGNTKTFIGWNKKKSFSKKYIDSIPFSISKNTPECFMIDFSNTDIFIIDIDVTCDNNAKDSLKQDIYDKLISKCKYAVKTGSGGIHFYFKKGTDCHIRTKTNIEAFSKWFVDGITGGVDILTDKVIVEGSIYAFEDKKYEYTRIIDGSSINDISFDEEIWEIVTAPFKEKKPLTNDSINRSDKSVEVDGKEIEEHIIKNISNDKTDWKEWSNMGLNIFNIFGSDGFNVFNEWSKKNEYYNELTTKKLWKGFRENRDESISIRGVGTIFYLSKQNNAIIYKDIRNKYKPLNYTTCKEILEIDHFFLEEPVPRFVRENDRSIVMYSFNDFKTLYGDFTYQEYDEDNNKILTKNVVDQWSKDQWKRRYKAIGHYPDVDKCPSNIYNSFISAEASFLDVPDKEINLEPILKHIYYIAGEEQKCADFIIQFLAQIVQQAGILVGIAIMIYGEQGVGKDILFHWFGNKVLGSQQYYAVGNAENLFKSFNADTACKTLLFCDEVNKQTLESNMDNLKRMITGASMRVEKKGVDAVSMVSYPRVVMTTNRNDAFNGLETDDRRMMFCNASSRMKGNLQYFTDLVNFLESDGVARAFYDYLMKYDISNFNHMNRPMTALYKQIREASMDNILKWIRDDELFDNDNEIRELSTTFLINYNIWAIKMGYYRMNNTSFGLRMNKLIDKNIGISRIKPNNKSYLVINKKNIMDYLTKEELL